jgi:hypothetical protein
MTDLNKLVEMIHNAPSMLVLEFAGAGSQALAWLHGVGGSSRTILEAHDRYAALALIEAVGFEPDQFASPGVAKVMAVKAYVRAVHLAQPNIPVAGVGCTAAIATDRPKRGHHQGFVAAYNGKMMTSYALRLTKGLRSRAEEEALVSLLILRVIARILGLSELPSLPLKGNERLQEEVERMDLLDQLMAQVVDRVTVTPDGDMVSGEPLSNIALFSGSFNPVHAGHRQLAVVAAQILDRPVYFELPLVNADKAPIDLGEARRRIGQFAGFAPVILTRTPLFSQKARLFPHTVFIIGVDTAERLIQPRFYDDDPDKMLAALKEIRMAGCYFLVAGRSQGSKFLRLQDLSLPAGYQELFEAIPEARFRLDVSSTTLRQTGLS